MKSFEGNFAKTIHSSDPSALAVQPPPPPPQVHKGMERTCSKKPGVASLPDDLIAEILTRVPYKSLCRFKCVSRSWLTICSLPGVRRKCPKTLSGFFFSRLVFSSEGLTSTGHFVNASGRGAPMVDPCLSFLPPGHRNAAIYDSCNGLLLCRRKDARAQDRSRYFVCNPATEKWIDLPDTGPMKRRYENPVIRLGFDPTMSSHFRVFLLVHEHDDDFRKRDLVTGLEIYSTETGRWTYMPSEWGDGIRVFVDSRTAFFDSTLHLTTLDSAVITVDTDGKTWRKILTPCNFVSIGLSQGRLHAVDSDKYSVWVLEDYVGQQWILKHIITAPELHGISMVHAIHPEQSLIFLTSGSMRNLMSYGIDTGKLHAIWTLGNDLMRIYPYIPCFSEWLSDGH